MTGLQSHSAHVKPGNWFYMFGDLSLAVKHIPEVEMRGATRIIVQTDSNLDTVLPVVKVDDVRLQYLQDCSVFYKDLFNSFDAFGVTGTKGKTSIAYGLHNLFRMLNKKSVYIGTLGTCYGDGLITGFNTTPGLHQLIGILDEARSRGISQVFMEISSQGLNQHRVPCQLFDQRAFTDLSPEHLDAHKTMSNYFSAKSQFFNPEYSMADKSFDVFCLDRSEYFQSISQVSGKSVKSFGLKTNHSFSISNIDFALGKSSFKIRLGNDEYDFNVPWTGFFNVENLCLILEIALSKGIKIESLQKVFRDLRVVPGRLEEIWGHPNGRVFVDYAHSTESLKFVCEAVRKLTTGRLLVLFGCGGDRDTSKRPAMGKVASEYADVIILSNDNPRNEDPDKIVDAIVEGIPQGQKYLRILNRNNAIRTAVFELKNDDVLLICGKGHESTMTSMGKVWESDDRRLARKAISEARVQEVHTINQLLQVPGSILLQSGLAKWCNGFQFDSRKVVPGNAFVAMKGESQDGINFIDSALKNGAGLVIVDRKNLHLDDRLSVIYHPEPLNFLQIAARNYRDSLSSFFIGITGSVGKTTCKDSLVHFLGSSAYGSPGNFNNTLGLPISILNMPPTTRFAVFEMGISMPGEMSQLAKCLNPDAMIFLPIYGSHRGNFESRQHLVSEKLKAAKFLTHESKIFTPSKHAHELEDLLGRSVISLEIDSSDFTEFGKGPACSIGFAREIALKLGVTDQVIETRISDLRLSPLRMETRKHNGWTFLLDCYNASPESTELFLESIETPERSHIVLADMLELGENSLEIHARILKKALKKNFLRLYLLGEFYEQAWKSMKSQYLHARCGYYVDKNLVLSELKMQETGFLGLKGSRFFQLETIVNLMGDEQAC